jgi:Na+-translocating ferredoxin:NAD+ oxidoreductase RnfG subunit
LRTEALTNAVAAGLLLAAAARGEVFATPAEALAQAFPSARIEKKVVLLDDARVAAVEQLAQAKLESHIATLYSAWQDDRALGYAFVDVQRVRTQPEALLVVISPEGRVLQTRMLAFHEPRDYLPPERWLHQFDERALASDLRVGGTVHGIAGATLSTRAVTSSIRRSLALFQVLVPGAPAPAGAAPKGG